jgi:acetyl-CoA acetyltransferase
MDTVPGLAMNRHCATSLSAVSVAAASIRAGMDCAVIAGGVESRSTAPISKWRSPGTDDWIDSWLPPSHPDRVDASNTDMSLTVGWNTAQLANVTREEMDEWAANSHRKAIEAIDEGRFVDEIVPIKAVQPPATRLASTLSSSTHPRPHNRATHSVNGVQAENGGQVLAHRAEQVLHDACALHIQMRIALVGVAHASVNLDVRRRVRQCRIDSNDLCRGGLERHVRALGGEARCREVEL